MADTKKKQQIGEHLVSFEQKLYVFHFFLAKTNKTKQKPQQFCPGQTKGLKMSIQTTFHFLKVDFETQCQNCYFWQS